MDTPYALSCSLDNYRDFGPKRHHYVGVIVCFLQIFEEILQTFDIHLFLKDDFLRLQTIKDTTYQIPIL
jgi:hypothetical protein